MGHKRTRAGKAWIFITAALAVVLLVAAPTAMQATGITASSSASAHDKVADVTCTAATVSLKNYDANATAKVTLDNVVKFEGKIPGSGYSLNETLEKTINHTLTVTVRSNDGAQYNLDFSKTTTDCTPPVGAPTQTVQCDAISADYHRPLTNGDHINVDISVRVDGKVTTLDQVNMYVDQNVTGGASYNGQNNLGLRWKILGVEQTLDPIPLTLDQVMAGVITFNYAPKLTEALAKLGHSSWIVSFVQTNHTDIWYEFECGDTTKKDAAATVSVKATATCDTISTVDFGLTNATWDADAETSVGEHTRPATAIPGSAFPDGTAHASVKYTIFDVDPSLCEAPLEATATISVGQQATCLADSTVTFNLVNATLGGVKPDMTPGHHELDAVAEGDALFPNGKPTTPLSYDIVKADKTLCPEVVVASNPSYSVVQTCGTITGTFTNVMTLKEGEVGETANFTMTDKNGTPQPVSVLPNETVPVTVEFAKDSGLQVVVIGVKDGKTAEYFIPTDCTNSPPVLSPEGPFLHDSCGVTDDGYSVPGTIRNATSSTNSETGDVSAHAEYVAKDGVYDVTDNTTNGVRTVTMTFTPFDKGAIVAEPGKDSTYKLIDGVATWKYTFDNEPCKSTPPPTDEPTPPTSTPVPPTTDTPVPPVVEPTPTPEPTPPTSTPVPPITSANPPVITPPTTPAKSVHVPATVKTATPPKALAETGTDMTPWLIAGALSVVFGLGCLVVGIRAKRREAKA